MKKTDRVLVKPLTFQAIPWHVLFLSVCPILILWAHNYSEVYAAAVILPLAASIIISGLLLLIVYAFFHDLWKAALVISTCLVLFFSYGHVYSLLKGITLSGFFVFRHRTLVPIWLVLAGLGIWMIFRTHANFLRLTKMLNLASAILFIIPVSQICGGLLKAWNTSGFAAHAQPSGTNSVQTTGLLETPDIYYIILDSYGRADRIQSLYDFDNSGFIQSLEALGFYVAGCSQANYNQTELSLASSLNFNYLQALDGTLTAGNNDRSPLWTLIKNGAVRQYLEARGYKTIAFATGYRWTEIRDAGIYFSPQASAWELNSFQYLLIQTTAGRVLLDASSLGLPNTPDDLIRRRTQFALEQLQVIPSIEGPKFVFAHLLVPHSFVFSSTGEPIAIDVSTMTPDIFRQGYLDQIIYIDKQIEILVAEIISSSRTPPIIIIQGDHGPAGSGPGDRMSILNAYFLPNQSSELFASLSPVNSFRVVLNGYFGENYPLLPDISYYSTYQDPYNAFIVQDNCVN